MTRMGFTVVAQHTARGVLLTAALAASALLAGCRIVSIDEDRALRAQRGSVFNADAEVGRIWAGKAMPALQGAARPMAELMPSIDADLAGAGKRYGRQIGEGSPWTFVVRGTGTIVGIDRASHRGTIEIAPDDARRTRTLQLQIGPVVTGTAIRDALPFVAFNDFSDQLAFADMGRALTTRALRQVNPALATLRPGARVDYVGVFNLLHGGDPILITPVTITPAPPRAG